MARVAAKLGNEWGLAAMGGWAFSIWNRNDKMLGMKRLQPIGL
jgi:hypothetical protein